MNNPNPFVPQGSILEQQSKRRSRLKLAVFCVLTVSVAGLSAMLIDGCNRGQSGTGDNGTSSSDLGTPPLVDTSSVPMTATSSVPTMQTSSVPVAVTPPTTPTMPTTPVTSAETYVVIKGDSFYTIAKKYGVKIKALEDANPGVLPTKLKVGEKLNIPAATGPTPTEATTGMTSTVDMTGATAGGQTYTIKSGDTLSKIAKSQGVTLKVLEAANPAVDPNHIKVGQKLTIPAAATTAPVPTTTTPPAPVSSPVTSTPPAEMPSTPPSTTTGN